MLFSLVGTLMVGVLAASVIFAGSHLIRRKAPKWVYPSHPLQPWTMVIPKVDRMSAVDTASVRVNPAVPGIAMARIVLLGRYIPAAAAMQAYDCGEAARRADIAADADFGADGLPAGLAWVSLEADDPLRAIVCAAAAKLG